MVAACILRGVVFNCYETHAVDAAKGRRFERREEEEERKGTEREKDNYGVIFGWLALVAH